MDERLGQGLWSALIIVGDRLAALIPAVVVLVALLVLGLLIGWMARVLVTRLARAVGVDRHLERWGISASLRKSGIPRPPSDVLGLVTLWGIFVVFASVGVDSLALPGAPGATAFLLSFLPPLLRRRAHPGRGVARRQLPQPGAPHRRRECAIARGAPPRSGGALGGPSLRGRDRPHPSRHRQGDGAGRVRHHVRWTGVRPRARVRPGRAVIARDILARRMRRESPPVEERLTHL